ncbi:MAG: hypothetical protein E8D46_17200 [Nitrospira sp.]|nr:MAG: hypothetical protein E8D46_17200 [Nitrospira sp.]
MKRPSNDNQAAIKPLNIAARTKIFSETELQRFIKKYFHGYEARRNLNCARSPSMPIPFIRSRLLVSPNLARCDLTGGAVG